MDDRRGDWSHGVDENLASLNAGQRVWEHEQKELRRALDKIDRLLRGDVEKNTAGIIDRLHELETAVAEFKAVLLMDKAGGNKGLINEVRELKEGREDRRLSWKLLTKIIVACIVSGLLGSLWPRIKALWEEPSKDPVNRMIEKAAHPKAKYRRYQITVPADENEPEKAREIP